MRELYNDLEEKFQPLELVAKVKASLDVIKEKAAVRAAEVAEAKAKAEKEAKEEAEKQQKLETKEGDAADPETNVLTGGVLAGVIGATTGAGTGSLVDLAKFSDPLTRLTVLRLLKQLATVYHSVKMDNFLALVAPLQLQRHAVRFVLLCCAFLFACSLARSLVVVVW